MVPRPESSCLVVLLAALGCEFGSNFAVSAGAPVSAAVRGTIFNCGTPVINGEVSLRVQQNDSSQVRPVDVTIGPIPTIRGNYVLEVGPSFAVPGPATAQLVVNALGRRLELPEFTLELTMGLPPRDTVRQDADLGLERGAC